MSRVGKKIIQLPQKVKVELKGRNLHVEGPLGKLDAVVPHGITLEVKNSTVSVGLESADGRAGKYQGLVRALLAKMIQGVVKGYERQLEITGVGYKAELKGDVMTLTLGYTHQINFKLPAGINAKIDKLTTVTISGIDNQLVGQVAAQIRSFKKPEPYQGKGVAYLGEKIKRKVGKTGAK